MNFLEGLDLNNTIPKRELLQHGAKYYGLHMVPQAVNKRNRLEHHPNIPHRRTPQLTCVYTTVQKYLNKPLRYPSGLEAWETNVSISSAQANGYLEEWAVLTEQTTSEIFDSMNECLFTWSKLWPKLAETFRCRGPVLIQAMKLPMRQSHFLLIHPRLWSSRRGSVPMHFGELGEDTRGSEGHGLPEKKLRDIDRVFGFADLLLALTTSKAKKMGYFGFVDKTESILRIVEECVELGMIPPL
ncbi:hypothetical protein N7522_001664 [Penicillium canescens]|nr:hypothetical protein N7522_001664 [Penicillium canescens]